MDDKLLCDCCSEATGVYMRWKGLLLCPDCYIAIHKNEPLFEAKGDD